MLCLPWLDVPARGYLKLAAAVIRFEKRAESNFSNRPFTAFEHTLPCRLGVVLLSCGVGAARNITVKIQVANEIRHLRWCSLLALKGDSQTVAQRERHT
jgi:hypothetical protein